MTFSMVIDIAAAFTAGGFECTPHRGVDGVTVEEISQWEQANPGISYRAFLGRTIDHRASMMFDTFGLIRAGTAVMQVFDRDHAKALDQLHEWLCVLYNDQTPSQRPMTAPARAPFTYQGVQFWRFRPKGEIQDKAEKYADWYVAEQLIEYAAKTV